MSSRRVAYEVLRRIEGDGAYANLALGPALEALYGGGLAPAQVQIKEPSLEDLFIKLTGREIRD